MEAKELNHSLDQVAKVFQSDLAKKDAEIKKLRERNEALKRQLDESNKQIEIHAKNEYIRKDAFIEKTINFLNYKLDDVVATRVPGTIIPYRVAKSELIEDLKNFMGE